MNVDQRDRVENKRRLLRPPTQIVLAGSRLTKLVRCKQVLSFMKKEE